MPRLPQLLDDRDPIFTDLDSRPDLSPDVLALFSRFGPGRYHAVNGDPSRMGQDPRVEDLRECLGVLLCLDGHGRVAGAVAICHYSDTQVTLWGPVVESGHQGRSFGPRLLLKAKEALRDGGFNSIRVLNDTRNRRARAFFLSHGLAPWKDDHIYEVDLTGDLPPRPAGISPARTADHGELCAVLLAAFPETSHCDRPLSQREHDGFRHYLLQDSGRIVGVAAVRGSGRRSWLSLYAVHPDHQGVGHGTRLLHGVLHAEAERGATSLALEVLEDNQRAIRIYEHAGFRRRWSASILVGPL